MNHLLPRLAALALLCASAGQAHAALACAAEMKSLVLGQVSVRDGYSTPTFGAATLSCSGGEPAATVNMCLVIGPGSGGAASGFSPRYMAGMGATSLDYQLTAQSSHASGGHTLDMLELPLVLDVTGAGSITTTIYAQITELGSQVKVGPYLSTFAGAGDLGFSFGEGSCTHAGDINSFTVSAEVAASCSVDLTPMDFGTVNSATTGPLDSTARMMVTCTNATAYTVGLDSGTHAADNSDTGRQMASGENRTRYGLFRDAGRSQGWGLAPGTVLAGTGTGSTQSINIHGRVFGAQTLARGLYSDTVVVVISY